MVQIEWGIKNVSVWKGAVIHWKGKSNKETWGQAPSWQQMWLEVCRVPRTKVQEALLTKVLFKADVCNPFLCLLCMLSPCYFQACILVLISGMYSITQQSWCQVGNEQNEWHTTRLPSHLPSFLGWSVSGFDHKPRLIVELGEIRSGHELYSYVSFQMNRLP